MPATKSWLQATGAANDILHMEAKSLAALVPAMAQAQRELAADLAHWMTKLGPKAAELKFTPAHLKQVQTILGIAQSQARMPAASFPVVAAQAVKNSMGLAMPHKLAARTLEGQMETLRAKFADLPSPQLVHAALIAKGDHLVMSNFTKSANRYAGQVGQDLKFQFGVGLAKGENIQQLTKRIASLTSYQKAVDASHPTHAAGAMAGALTKRYHHWAQRLVRTELNGAYNKTAHDGILAVHKLDDRIRMMWDAANDLRVCVYCRSLHGTKADATGSFKGVQRPPAHPNCRCALVSWMDEWADDHVPDIPTAEEVEAKSKALEAQVDAGTKRKEPEPSPAEVLRPAALSPERAKAEKRVQDAEAALNKPLITVDRDGWHQAFVQGDPKAKAKKLKFGDGEGAGPTSEAAIARAREKMADELKTAKYKLRELLEKEERAIKKAKQVADKVAGVVTKPVLPAAAHQEGGQIPERQNLMSLRRRGLVMRNAEGRLVLSKLGAHFFNDKIKKEVKRAETEGTCQICEGLFAMVRGKISLHGYTRPGTGRIMGKCRGAVRLPWEVSCDAVEGWLATVQSWLESDLRLLAETDDRKEYLIEEKVVDATGQVQYRNIKDKNGQVTGKVAVTTPKIITAEDPRWGLTKAQFISGKVRDIEWARNEIARQTRRLAAWKPVPGFVIK